MAQYWGSLGEWRVVTEECMSQILHWTCYFELETHLDCDVIRVNGPTLYHRLPSERR